MIFGDVVSFLFCKYAMPKIYRMLKRTIFFLSFCSCFIPIYAQKPVSKAPVRDVFEYQHILKVNLLSPLFGIVNFHYERNINPNSSTQAEFFYYTGQTFGQSVGVQGFGLTYNYRFYLTGTFPSGWYVQPYARYQNYFESTQHANGFVNGTGSQDHVSVYSLGMVFGYQVVFAKRICFDMFLGPNYNKSFENGSQISSQSLPPMFSGGAVRLGCTLGFVF